MTQDNTWPTLALTDTSLRNMACVATNKTTWARYTWSGTWQGAPLSVMIQSGYDLTGATMYVTLEPCCHQGKTPPCTDAEFARRAYLDIIGMPAMRGKTVVFGLTRSGTAGVNAGAADGAADRVGERAPV